MKQSELNFKENSKLCVWCEWNGIEFYWEARSEVILITPASYSNIYIPADAPAKSARLLILRFIKEAFGV
ncbi:MAG: hypothetical protein [Inoviridae sp.]|nr:MAG: hypothetical protein [Inoviridae sp.]